MQVQYAHSAKKWNNRIMQLRKYLRTFRSYQKVDSTITEKQSCKNQKVAILLTIKDPPVSSSSLKNNWQLDHITRAQWDEKSSRQWPQRHHDEIQDSVSSSSQDRDSDYGNKGIVVVKFVISDKVEVLTWYRFLPISLLKGIKNKLSNFPFKWTEADLLMQ